MSSSALRKLKQAQLTDQVAPPAKPQLVQDAAARAENGPRGAMEIISPPEQMRRQIETSLLRDNRVQRDVDVERARADIQDRLREALRKYNDHEGSDAISEIIFIRANVGEIKRRYVDIARRLFTLHRQTPEIYRALTRDPSLIDLGSDSDISKLRTVGEALHVGKVLEDWLPKSKEAAYEVAKLDEVVIREGRDSGIIVPDAKVSAIKAWVKSKSQRVMIEAVVTVDSIDVKIGQLLKQQEDIQDEATRRINAISLEIKSLKAKKEELLKEDDERH